jgi:hypothetical protein
LTHKHTEFNMPKFDVVIDTNIYRKNPSRTDLAFQALERLCKHKIVKLHLPYVVEREFQTQQVDTYNKELKAAISALDAIMRKGLSSDVNIRVKAIREGLDAEVKHVVTDVESALPNWAKSIGATRHPITESQAVAAMESYFQGRPPLKQPKTREDIPDSFIFQTILELSKTSSNLNVIAEDGKVAEASEGIAGVKSHRSLSSFIESKEIQAEILELDVIENLPAIQKLLLELEFDSRALSAIIQDKAASKLYGEVVHSRSIPDDNHEGTITMYGEPDDIEPDFDDISYFGSGEFGIPFTFTSQVYITYYIFKADFYSIDESKMPSISDHNDHYYEAEQEVYISASGLLKISIPLGELKNIRSETIEELIDATVDSVDNIELIE